MRKLILFVVALFAIFTLIKAFTSVNPAVDTTPPPTITLQPR